MKSNLAMGGGGDSPAITIKEFWNCIYTLVEIASDQKINYGNR
jgi:hypothetical protein